MPVAGYIITAWSKRGALAVGRCAEPNIPADIDRGMVSGWVVRNTSRDFGRDAFGDDFSHEGPSCVYGGDCLKAPAGEKYPGAWAESTLRGLVVDGVPAVPDPKAAVESVLAGPEWPLSYAGANSTLKVVAGVNGAINDLAAHTRKIRAQGGR